MSEKPLGSTREASSREAPSLQGDLRFGSKYSHHQDVSELRAVFRAAVMKAGGVEWLALELGHNLAYASKISEALNGVEGRHIQFEAWLPPLLGHWEAMEVLFGYLTERTQREHPKPKRVATDGELLKAIVEKALESGKLGDALIEEAARSIGVNAGAFRR